jgi:hypothetical protein
MRVLTNAQKLTNAVRACKRKPRKRRPICKKQALKQYGTGTGTGGGSALFW